MDCRCVTMTKRSPKDEDVGYVPSKKGTNTSFVRTMPVHRECVRSYQQYLSPPF